MQAKIHKEMAYQILVDHPKQTALEFLLTGISRPEWQKDMLTKVKWLKEWMDMPDNQKHSSKLKNDHSYKLKKTDKGFRIVFAKTGDDQATVIARLKYAARSIREWNVEEEYRACALEFAKSIHWLVDLSSPSHTTDGWSKKEHSKIEQDFDKLWKTLYDKKQIKFNRKNAIGDIYKWAKKNIEQRYDKNMQLLKLYQDGGSINDAKGKELGREMIQSLAQNFADYIAYTDRYIKFPTILAKLLT